MKTETNIKYYSPILEEATASITPQERAAFDLNYDISERIYQIIQEKGMTKRDLARLTGKKESEVSRWFMLGHNFTCKTIALIQLALGEKIVEVVK
ncbi:MAG: helix-turn-helix domain-containing protein [Bacteroidales bacterium]|nr:helix-turn-helix domain-containing protein [Bacteroidales bacterium]